MTTKTRTLSITSGKGGVGKTTLVANLALSLAKQGERVLIFDGDLGMANVDIFFGVRPEGDLGDVLAGRKAIRDILIEVAPGVHLLPGGSGLPDFNGMNNFQRRSLLDSVSELSHQFTWMLIDTAPGIADNVLYLNSAADETAVILTPDPASFADAYALIKVLHQKHREHRFKIVCNMIKDEAEGFALFRRFYDVVAKFLDVSLDYWGTIPMDTQLRRANQMQRLVLKQDPQSVSAIAIRAIAAQAQSQPQNARIKGGLQLFWNQVVGLA